MADGLGENFLGFFQECERQACGAIWGVEKSLEEMRIGRASDFILVAKGQSQLGTEATERHQELLVANALAHGRVNLVGVSSSATRKVSIASRAAATASSPRPNRSRCCA